MRLWAEVYDGAGTLLAYIDSLISASAARRLDQAGTFDLSCGLDEYVISHLTPGNQIVLYSQESDDAAPMVETRGIIIQQKVQENGGGLSIAITGRDLLDELRYSTVGLGRSYQAQTVETIIDDLLSLADGWTGLYEAAAAAQLQSARYDGTKILKALVRTVKELGMHFRLGNGRVVEVGQFGEVLTLNGQPIRAIRPPSSISRELLNNDAVLLVDDISVRQDVDSVVNWAIPMGAGEGVAATTLKDTTYQILNTDNTVYRSGTTPDYPIYRRVNDFGIAEYYVDATDGDNRREDTLSFKEIGPVANATLAKQLASNALAKATFESLRRTRTTNTSYTVSVKKVRVDIQPGDVIRLTYKGVVQMTGNAHAAAPELTYIDVNEDVWVMAVQRSISDAGIVTTLTVNTVDQHIKDDTDILVEVLDRSEVQNYSLQTFPYGFQDTERAIIQGSTSPSDAQYKTANFTVEVDSIFTEVVMVRLRLITEPLVSTTDVGAVSGPLPEALQYNYAVYPSPNYPSDITLKIDGVDVTSALGGPWNPSAGNSAVDVKLDITSYITEAAGGLYQKHTLVFAAGMKTGEGRVSTAHPSAPANNTSNGYIVCKVLFFGTARGVLPD